MGIAPATLRPGPQPAATVDDAAAAASVAPSNRAHPGYPPIKLREGREVLRSSAQTPHAALRLSTLAKLRQRSGQARLDYLDYRLPKGDIAWRLADNARRAAAAGRAEPDVETFRPLVLDAFVPGQPFVLRGKHVEGHALGATVRNEVFPDGTVVASSQGWELMSDWRLQGAVRSSTPIDVDPKPEMQDTHLATAIDVDAAGATRALPVRAVLDGHGYFGGQVAREARDRLSAALTQRLSEFNPVAWAQDDVYAALKLAPPDVGRAIATTTGGTTLTASLVDGLDIWGMGLGDSPFMIVTPDGGFRASEDAKVDRGNRFGKSMIERGGEIRRGRLDGNLAMTRALADHNLKGHVGARPKLTRHTRPADERWYLLHMSDGVSDVASTRQVVDLVHRRLREGATLAQIAAEVVCTVLNSGAYDNLTFLMAPVGPEAVPAPALAPRDPDAIEPT